MEKRTIMQALGLKGSADDEGEDAEADEEGSDSDPLYEDLELALDPSSDPDTRAEAFRRAVKACR